MIETVVSTNKKIITKVKMNYDDANRNKNIKKFRYLQKWMILMMTTRKSNRKQHIFTRNDEVLSKTFVPLQNYDDN